MRICVFGAASAHIDDKYIKAVEELGAEIAARGHELVFGGGGSGLMGAVARGVKRGGGYIHGIVPSFFRDDGVEALFDGADKMTYTDDMSERKRLMEELAEAYIIVPGGVGTLDEFFEILTLKQLGRHDKAIVVYNIDGYFDALESFMVRMADGRFVTRECKNMYAQAETAGDAIANIEDYTPTGAGWKKLKLGD
ncbi:MAG: TIGR00730 family Rossman fold protein [Roseburia sp.]|nr:TIGR00730 family Rossman fold protein [Roseburia sp.]